MAFSMRHPIRSNRKQSQIPQADYIKNLQQQIYLLELETRYMKGHSLSPESGKLSKAASMNLKAPATPNPTETSNKKEFEELKELNQQLTFNLETAQNQHKIKQDDLNGQIIKIKKQNEQLEIETQFLKSRVNRLLDEKDKLVAEKSELGQQNASQLSKIRELLQLQESLNKSHEASQQSNRLAQDKIKELELQLQAQSISFYENKLKEANLDIARLEANLKSEKFEHQRSIEKESLMREEMILSETRACNAAKTCKDLEALLASKQESPTKVNDDSASKLMELNSQMDNKMRMLQMTNDSKEATIQELRNKLQEHELIISKTLESELSNEKKIESLEELIKNREAEYVQVGQLNTTLQDELNSCKTQLEIRDKQIHSLKIKLKSLEEEAVNFKVEEKKWNEFAKKIDEVEQTGETYLAMMKGIKSQLRSN